MEEGGVVECMQYDDGDACHTAPRHSELPAVEHGGLSGGHPASMNMDTKSPSKHHLHLQNRRQLGSNAHGHAHARRHHQQAAHLDGRQLVTLVLSNNEYATSTTATVQLGRDPSPTSSVFPASTTTARESDEVDGHGSDIEQRSSREDESPPSSPVRVDVPVSVITLSNTSPILHPTTTTRTRTRRPGTATTSPRRVNPKTTSRRRPTRTSTSTSRRRPATRPPPSPARTPPAPTSTSPLAIAPAPGAVDPPEQAPSPRISNVVHICIARPPASAEGAPPPPLITFTSTATFRNGIPAISRATPPTRATKSRDPPPPPAQGTDAVITVTDFNCQLTLPAFTRQTGTAFPSPATLSPSNGLGIDNSTLAPLGPAAADPTSGNGDNGMNSDNDVAFFATPGGKGTIAGITIASAALLISFVLFFLWRKKKNDDEGVYTAGATRASASSFGDSSGDQNSPSQTAIANIPLAASNASAALWDNEMAQGGTGPPGSFFVQRRSQPSSIRGTRTPPYPASAKQLDAALAARAISPLAMLQQRPEAFITPPPRTAGGQYSNEGHSGEGDPSSGSSAGHANTNDPFRDPSSTGHSQIGHDPNIIAAYVAGDKHERRRSGYTSDTYRKSRSRPLSVRNPDSDETRQEGVESLYIDRTPRSASSDALYNIEDSQIPDSTGLEYYLGSTVPTPRTTTSSQATMMPPPPPVPANTMMYDFGEMPETPRAARGQTPWAAGHPSSQPHQQPYPQPEQAIPYGGLADEQPGPSRALPEFEPQMTYAYPQPRPIVSEGSSGNLSRPYLHHTSMQSTLQPPIQPAPGPSSTSSQAIHQVRTAATAATPQTRQHRQSTVSSDGASSRSSIWRAWEHSNRSWVNEGFETPNDVQDVQLGINANAVGGGNATAISGYFAWR